jgi:hypothetical protein
VRHTSHRPHRCTSVVMRAVQLRTSTRLGCTPVWKVSSHMYSCTDQVIQFVRVYTPYTLKSPPYSHHEPRGATAQVGEQDHILNLVCISSKSKSGSGCCIELLGTGSSMGTVLWQESVPKNSRGVLVHRWYKLRHFSIEFSYTTGNDSTG